MPVPGVMRCKTTALCCACDALCRAIIRSDNPEPPRRTASATPRHPRPPWRKWPAAYRLSARLSRSDIWCAHSVQLAGNNVHFVAADDVRTARRSCSLWKRPATWCHPSSATQIAFPRVHSRFRFHDYYWHHASLETASWLSTSSPRGCARRTRSRGATSASFTIQSRRCSCRIATSGDALKSGTPDQ